MMRELRENLGFTFYLSKNGDVRIKRNDNQVTKLSGNTAKRFIEDITDKSFEKQQQIMARITGNYKRGNERKTKNHPKNTSY